MNNIIRGKTNDCKGKSKERLIENGKRRSKQWVGKGIKI